MPSNTEITAGMTDCWAPLRLWYRRPHDCGPCCLYFILRHYGIRVELKTLRHATGWGWGGTSLHGLAQGAEALGLRATCVKIDAALLSEVAYPVIAHIQQRHFVVVLGANPRQALLVDPRFGLGHVSRDTFEEMWIGHLLHLWV